MTDVGVEHTVTGSQERGGAEYLKPITVGICAMNKKSKSQPMMNILSRMREHDYVEIIMFSDDVILNSPIEHWPVCDCLIAFFSKGFPLDKASDYVKLRKPLVLNDLQMQYSLMDRRKVYEILAKNGIEVPRHTVYNRSDDSTENVVETDDMVEIKGQVFHKPFVEKPVSAEDHNIYIYFPSDYGGGSQRLFRKVRNRSSTYSSESSVRNTGSYIYEDFLATDGTDVKVYTVGPDYAHAEARKSPALDGKVERDEGGKEVRYPVILTAKEKLIARQVCLAFKQTVCGFDLLRANGKSYVCDVNGFSFVKNSQKYYDDCAQILLEMITAQLAPHYFPPIPPSVEYLAEEIPDLPVSIPKTGNQLELRCVIGVIRHGDRTPKQKMKMVVTHWRFFQLFEELNGYKKGHLKIKKPKELQKVLNIARCLLEHHQNEHEEIDELTRKLTTLRTVLEMYGKFSGINRKVQFQLLNRKDPADVPKLLLILKWGGELTLAGKMQAEELGQAFRCTYPGGEGEYSSLPGSGFLRLHSTYRHDLKVYASDEGRVQITASAFTKGLLDLEGSLASILVHLVKRDQAATNMLDTSTDAQDAMNNVKERLQSMMRSSEDFTDGTISKLAPTHPKAIIEAMDTVKNPREKCEQLYEQIKALLTEIRKKADSEASYVLNHGESLQLMINRWAKLEKDFKSKTGYFDISKIPDIYDCIKYDLLHNNSLLHLKTAKELFDSARPFADIVIPQEYGITEEEKVDIAKKICTPLLRKIQSDLHHTIVDEQDDIIHRLDHRISKGVISPKRHVRTRLYFTSESHVHSLVNILRYGGLLKGDDSKWKESMEALGKCPELNYMTQIIFMLFEDKSQPQGSLERYRVDIHFSPGVKTQVELLTHSRSSVPDMLAPLKTSSPEANLKMGQAFVRRKTAEEPTSLRKLNDHIFPSLIVPPWKNSGVAAIARNVSHDTSGTTNLKDSPTEAPFEGVLGHAADIRNEKKEHVDCSSPATNRDGRLRSLRKPSLSESDLNDSCKVVDDSRRKTCSEGELPQNSRTEDGVHVDMNSQQDDTRSHMKSSDQSPTYTGERVIIDFETSKQDENVLKTESLPALSLAGLRKKSLPGLLASSSSPSFVIGTIEENFLNGSRKWGSIDRLHETSTGLTTDEPDRGLELAAGLASQMEPLIPLTFISLEQANEFLTSLTGVKVDFSLKRSPPSPVKPCSSRRSGLFTRLTPPATPSDKNQTTPRPKSAFNDSMIDSNADLRTSLQSLEDVEQRPVQFGQVSVDSDDHARVSVGSLVAKENTGFQHPRRHSVDNFVHKY